ncbi:hypothetical protein CMUS01_08286 [Colletotrichum musicola]|uniref:Uncharacterized protein n=1 Tax=Colletotrichum musicola TaxID=2175873 RepID=A0A8H6NE30_9PEZI|nr:hypothetical protein CMUS01_08286 [Colletotrichum musicola]
MHSGRHENYGPSDGYGRGRGSDYDRRGGGYSEGRDSYDRDDKKSSSGSGGLLGGMLGGGGGGKDKKDKKDNDGGFTDKVIDGVAEYAKKKW